MTQPQDNHPLHLDIHQKLASIAAASATPPSWQEAWLRLGPNSTDEDRLEVYRDVRDSGTLPVEAGFFLVAWMLDVLTDRRAEEELREPEARLEAIRQKYNLPENAQEESEAVPAEYQEVLRELHDARCALYASTMEEFGEHELARHYWEDREQFVQTYEAGHNFFHGSESDGDTEDDVWLDMLLTAVSACVEAASPMGPLGLRYHEEDGFWDITIHPTPVELVGGRHDGERVSAGFSLDLEQLRSIFDSILDFGWQALGLNSTEGPSVWVEGVYLGREVFVQVLAYPPEDEEPSLKIETS